MTDGRIALEVWGDPIVNSASPQLHRAAYAQLGLPWEFGRRQVRIADFDAVLRDAKDRLLGAAVTMPLKRKAFLAADSRDRAAELTGAVNTLVMGKELRGYNTDVWGVVDALRVHGVEHVEGSVRILGAGATAASALVALIFLGAERVDVCARDVSKGRGLMQLADVLGAKLRTHSFEATLKPASVTISTLPGQSLLPPFVVTKLAESGGLLFDVAYHPWPTQLASSWLSGRVISGHELLLRQAVRQLRIFVSGDPEAELKDELSVIARMQEALVGD